MLSLEDTGFGGLKGGGKIVSPPKEVGTSKNVFLFREATNLFRETFLRRNRFWRELEKKQHWHDFRLS